MNEHQQISRRTRKSLDSIWRETALLHILDLRDNALRIRRYVYPVNNCRPVGDLLRLLGGNHYRRIAVDRIIGVGDHAVGGEIYSR